MVHRLSHPSIFIFSLVISLICIHPSYGAQDGKGQPSIPGVTGTFGTATQVSQITVKDGKVTAASNVDIVLATGAITGAMLATANGLGTNGQVLTTDGNGGLSWSNNVPGPQGPTGPQGPEGPQGPQGEPGESVVNADGHVIYSGGTPSTLGQCPATVEGTDNAGTITFTGAVQTCSIYFAVDHANEPSCVVSFSTAGVAIGVKNFIDRMEVSAESNFAANERLHYHCVALQ